MTTKHEHNRMTFIFAFDRCKYDVIPGDLQSRSQSPQAFLSAVGRLERLWDNGMEVRRDNRSLYEAANQKQDILFDFSRDSPGDQPLTKSLRTLGLRLGDLWIDFISA